MIEIKPPTPLSGFSGSAGIRIFLAGSIEQGKAVDWQTEVRAIFVGTNVTILNPRRDKWDASWEQSITNPQFAEQVTWELDALAWADLIVMYIDPKTQSPISLMEFGQYYTSGKLIMCCPPGFYRRGNIEVCCDRTGIRLFNSLEELKEALKVLANNFS